MRLIFLPLHYLWWHYTLALWDLAIILRDLWLFLFRFFSLPTLVRTLLAPWRRLAESYPSGFNPQAVLEIVVVNTLMRLVGFIFRLVMIVISIIVLIAAAILGVIFFLLWLLSPLIIFLLATGGVFFLIKT
ncbi:MAG: hypothetical protein HYT48_02105 [Candidatus Vogelbacteria bacterium]|nr:hypothetical protein [Candidatus Vogelbacteria bacterium]